MKKKIILIFISLLMVTGCGSNNNQLDKLSDVIINLHQDYDYDISKLSKTNQELISKFKEEQREENKIINITKLDLFGPDMQTSEPDTEEVYEENGIYYIKYNDLDFERINKKDYIATINANGYTVNLLKSQFPILFEETRGINYKYRFMKKETIGDKVNYYYRSYGDGSMLTIEYKMDGNKIDSIDLIYDSYYLLDEIEPTEEENSKVGSIIFLALLAVGLGFVIIKALKSYSNARKI